MGLFNGMKNKVDEMKFDFKYGNGLDKVKVVGKAAVKTAITGVEVATIFTNVGAGFKIAGTANKLCKQRKGVKYVYTFTKNAQRTKITKIAAKVNCAKSNIKKMKYANHALTVMDAYNNLTDNQIADIENYINYIKECDAKRIVDFGELFERMTVEGRCKDNFYKAGFIRNIMIKDLQVKLKELDVELDANELEKIYDEFIKEENMIELFWGIIYDRIAELVNKGVADRKIRKYIDKDCVTDCYATLVDTEFTEEYIINEMILANITEEDVEDKVEEDNNEVCHEEEVNLFNNCNAYDFKRKMNI